MLLLVLKRAEKGAGLVGRHLPILPLLGFRGIGTLLLFLVTLLTAAEGTFLFGRGGGCGCRLRSLIGRLLLLLICFLLLTLLGLLILLTLLIFLLVLGGSSLSLIGRG